MSTSAARQDNEQEAVEEEQEDFFMHKWAKGSSACSEASYGWGSSSSLAWSEHDEPQASEDCGPESGSEALVPSDDCFALNRADVGTFLEHDEDHFVQGPSAPKPRENEPADYFIRKHATEPLNSDTYMAPGLRHETMIRAVNPGQETELWQAYHPCYAYQTFTRRLQIGDATPGSFGEALQNHAGLHDQGMPLVIAGFDEPPGNFVKPCKHGSGTLLTPPTYCNGQWRVGIATAGHVIFDHPHLKYYMSAQMNCLAEGSSWDPDQWVPIDEADLQRPAVTIPENLQMLACVDGELSLVAEPCDATSEHEAIVEQEEYYLRDLDVSVFSTAVPQNAQGEVFPFQDSQGWNSSMRKAWVVPTSPTPPVDGTPSLVLSGTPGHIPDKVLQGTYGIPLDCPDDQRQAQKLETKALHSLHAVASVGDAVACDQHFICHRASAGHGMSGCGASCLRDSGLLLGIHFSSGGDPWQYNYLYAVNHPGFVIQYGQQALPLLRTCVAEDFPTGTMRHALKEWVSHHIHLLDMAGCGADAGHILAFL